MDYQYAVWAVGNPATSAEELSRVAEAFPQLGPQIVVHPNCFPELEAWLNAYAPVAQVGEPVPVEGAPVAGKSRMGVFIGLAVAAFVLLGGGATAALLVLGGHAPTDAPMQPRGPLSLTSPPTFLGETDDAGRRIVITEKYFVVFDEDSGQRYVVIDVETGNSLLEISPNGPNEMLRFGGINAASDEVVVRRIVETGGSNQEWVESIDILSGETSARVNLTEHFGPKIYGASFAGESSDFIVTYRRSGDGQAAVARLDGRSADPVLWDATVPSGGGRVWVTSVTDVVRTAERADSEGATYGDNVNFLDPDSGELVYSGFGSSPEIVNAEISVHGYLSHDGTCGPINDSGRLEVKGLDPSSGDVVWTYVLSQGGMFFDPLCSAGDVIFYTGHELVSLDSFTGSENWRIVPDGSLAGAFAIDGRVLVGFVGGVMTGFDMASGMVAWQGYDMGEDQPTFVIKGETLMLVSTDERILVFGTE